MTSLTPLLWRHYVYRKVLAKLDQIQRVAIMKSVATRQLSVDEALAAIQQVLIPSYPRTLPSCPHAFMLSYSRTLIPSYPTLVPYPYDLIPFIPSYPHTLIPSYPHTLIPSWPLTLIPSYPLTLIPSYHHRGYEGMIRIVRWCEGVRVWRYESMKSMRVWG